MAHRDSDDRLVISDIDLDHIEILNELRGVSEFNASDDNEIIQEELQKIAGKEGTYELIYDEKYHDTVGVDRNNHVFSLMVKKEQKTELSESAQEAMRQERIDRMRKRREAELKEEYTPEEREAIELAIMENYPGLEESEFDFRKGLNGMVDVRFNESGKFSTNGIWEKSLLEEGEKLRTEKREPRLVEATINDIDAEKASRTVVLR